MQKYKRDIEPKDMKGESGLSPLNYPLHDIRKFYQLEDRFGYIARRKSYAFTGG